MPGQEVVSSTTTATTTSQKSKTQASETGSDDSSKDNSVHDEDLAPVQDNNEGNNISKGINSNKDDEKGEGDEDEDEDGGEDNDELEGRKKRETKDSQVTISSTTSNNNNSEAEVGSQEYETEENEPLLTGELEIQLEQHHQRQFLTIPIDQIPNETYRVKVYILKNKAWIDLGIGRCGIHSYPTEPDLDAEGDNEGPYIIVIGEKSLKLNNSGNQDQNENHSQEYHPDIILNCCVKEVFYHAYTAANEAFNNAISTEKAEWQGMKGLERAGCFILNSSLIIWTEPDGREMALSFAHAQGCEDIWKTIASIRANMFPEEEDLSSPEGFITWGGFNDGLPEPTLANLRDIEAGIKLTARSATDRERLCNDIFQTSFIDKLIPLREEAEACESVEYLHILCSLMQLIILLNDNAIIEYILKDKVFLGVVSILEYDPQFGNMKASYVDQVGDPNNYKEVVEIPSDEIRQKIHIAYRIKYLKDVILPRILDDSTFSGLNSTIYYSEVEIVQGLWNHPNFFDQLFQIFQDVDPTAPPADQQEALMFNKEHGKKEQQNQKHAKKERKKNIDADDHDQSMSTNDTSKKYFTERQRDGLVFLQQYCSMIKNLQISDRASFYNSLVSRGLLTVIKYALSLQHDDHARKAAIDMLMMVIDHDSASIRNNCLLQNEAGSHSVLTFIIDVFHNDPDIGLKSQLAEAIRILTQSIPENLTIEQRNILRGRQEDPEVEKFLSYFYDNCASRLIKPLTQLPSYQQLVEQGTKLELSIDQMTLCGHLCDLLCFFVNTHTSRSKLFILDSHVVQNLASLFLAKQKHLRLAALRFFRSCIGQNDDYINRSIMKDSLFDPIIDMCTAELENDNLLSSACLELFEHIQHNDLRSLIRHNCERYNESITKFAVNYPPFQKILTKYKEIIAPPKETKLDEQNNNKRPRAAWAGDGGLDQEEESYFNESEDDTDTDPDISNENMSLRGPKRQKTESPSRSPSRLADYQKVKTIPSTVLTTSSETQKEAMNGQMVGLVEYGDDDDDEEDDNNNNKNNNNNNNNGDQDGNNNDDINVDSKDNDNGDCDEGDSKDDKGQENQNMPSVDQEDRSKQKSSKSKRKSKSRCTASTTTSTASLPRLVKKSSTIQINSNIAKDSMKEGSNEESDDEEKLPPHLDIRQEQSHDNEDDKLGLLAKKSKDLSASSTTKDSHSDVPANIGNNGKGALKINLALGKRKKG